MTQRELNEPFFIYEHEGGTAQPATPINASGVELGLIPVNFSRPPQDSQFGGTQVENYIPQASALTDDVKDLTNACGMIIHHGVIVEEDGQTVECDEDGEETVDENQFTYNIKSNRPDSEGISILTFTQD